MGKPVDTPLKPCPARCGEKPRLYIGLSEFEDGEVHCPCGWTSGNHPTGDAAAAFWNKRGEN